MIHDFVFAESSNSFTFSLYEILSTRRRLHSRPHSYRTSHSYRTFHSSDRILDVQAPSAEKSSCAVKSHLFSVRSLLTPSETCLSITARAILHVV